MTAWLLRFIDVSRAWRATCWYIVFTVILTWPLVPNLTRDIPGDLGDPLFVCWAIARAADHWLALLSGDVGAAIRFWHAGFFHPEPLVTVYSEHFVVHALLILPVWVLTTNIILCYNLLFLATFVIGGTGMYLLARELTGSARGAFVAGLMFMFTPYRFATMTHLQVLSSQWMPFALFGLRRYFVTGRKLALAGGAGAVLLQNLSSGYYLIYFAPFVGLYALVEMWSLRLRSGQAGGFVRGWQAWRDLVVAGIATLALTLPFALPYVILQRRLNYRRPLAEIQMYAADLFGWLTADTGMNVWGWLRLFPRNEGYLFPGSVIVVLGIVGVIVTWQASGASDSARPHRVMASFALCACLLAMWTAMGPTPTMAGKPLPIPAIYGFLYEHVPGFDVSRVSSRFTTVAVLFLAVAAAYGAAWLDRTGRRTLLAVAAVGVLLDGSMLPLRRNQVFTTSSETRPPEGRVYPEKDAPALWRYLKTLPADAVLAHLPFGYPEHELRYLYYSRIDGHRLSNGYSGAFPLSYYQRAEVLQHAIEMPEKAVARLREDEVSYVVVHTDLFPSDLGLQTVAALEGAGMRPAMRIGTVVVLEVP